MIPVSLYGVDVDNCEEFYRQLPSLVSDTIDDEHYSDALFAIQDRASMEHISKFRSAGLEGNHSPFLKKSSTK